jgi:hypothetical protein
MSDVVTESRASIIDAVKTPLGFMVLGFLIVDVTVAGLAVTLQDFRAPLVWTVICSIPVFVLTVIGVAVWRPEALRGDRPLQEVYANQFASDLFIALDGALSNLEVLEREEAWLTVADVITSDSHADQSYAKFCTAVAARLKKLTNLANKTLRTRGLIEP